MLYIKQTDLEQLMEGFTEFFSGIFKAIREGRLEDALTIAEAAMAFMAEILDREDDDSGKDANLFIFVENPQKV